MKKRPALILSACLILLITFAALSPSLKNGFTNYDDDLYVTENRAITDISPANIQKIFSSFKLGLYVPLTIFSFALEYHFVGLSPFTYHLTNLLLHLANCLLVFWMIYLVCGSFGVAFLVGILFGIHPMHVESVAWVSERKDVLYAFFFFCSAIAYLYYRKKEAKPWYYLSLSAFFISLLAKPAAIVLPFVLFAFDYLKGRKLDKKAILEKLPFLALAAVFALINIFAQIYDPDPRPKLPLNMPDLFFRAAYSVVFYIGKLFWPLKLSAVYSFPKASGWIFPAQMALSSLAVLFLAAVVLWARKNNRKFFFGAAFFFITLVPALGVVPIFVGFAADRYTYIPYIGIFYILAEWVYSLYQRGRAAKVLVAAGALIATAGLSALTYQRSMAWKNSVTLWKDVVDNYPEEPYAYYSIGLVHMKQNNLNDAQLWLDEAVALRTDFVEARLNRAVVYSRLGMDGQAIREYGRIIDICPRCFEAYNNRGNIYGRQGKLGLAIADFSAAVRINPFYAISYYNRAISYFSKKEYEKCLEDLGRARALGAQVDPTLIEEVKKYR